MSIDRLTGHPSPLAVRFGPTIAPAPKAAEPVRCPTCGTLLSEKGLTRPCPLGCDEDGTA